MEKMKEWQWSTFTNLHSYVYNTYFKCVYYMFTTEFINYTYHSAFAWCISVSDIKLWLWSNVFIFNYKIKVGWVKRALWNEAITTAIIHWVIFLQLFEDWLCACMCALWMFYCTFVHAYMSWNDAYFLKLYTYIYVLIFYIFWRM